MARREQLIRVHHPKRRAEASRIESSQGSAPNERRPGAAAQLAAVHRTLRHGPEPRRQAGANRTGLPDRLKSGAEALSGMSLDDVRVHYNSARPTQLQALAFTQGSDIHVAPGQERHLPHEAWHVVQQKQGRVKPTIQLKDGVPVNDEAGLEREADAMGAMAAGLRAPGPDAAAAGPAPAGGGSAPVQRKMLVYNDGSALEKSDKGNVETACKALDTAVAKATQMIQADPMLTSVSGNNFIAAWVKVFVSMIGTKAIPEFFYARYGYAVETLASWLLPKSFGDLTVTTQHATGATRPDFVVWKDKKDIGWLDITSSASAGHILAKQHSGWTSRPYVAEVLYDPPKVTDFSSGKGLTDEHKKAFAQIGENQAQAEIDYQTGHDALADMIEQALEDGRAQSKDGKLSAGAAKNAVWEKLKGIFTNISAADAGQVLRCIENLIVGSESHPGAAWANWAFKGQGYANGRALLIAYGKQKREAAAKGSSEMVDDEQKSKDTGTSSQKQGK